MTKAKLPVSTSQAVIGAIIGWNLLLEHPLTYPRSLRYLLVGYKSCNSWHICFFNFRSDKKNNIKQRIHLLLLDNYTRTGLIVVGALASYSLGANI
jgi:PiT family inorganic phosphate transporter